MAGWMIHRWIIQEWMDEQTSSRMKGLDECDTFMGGTSRGDGRYAQTASSSGCTPLFLKAEPHRTGTNVLEMAPCLISLTMVASSGSLPYSASHASGF